MRQMPSQICFCLWEWSTLCVFNALGSKIKWIHKTSYCHSLGRGGLAIKNSCSDEHYGRNDFSIMKLSITPFSIKGLLVTLSISDNQHTQHSLWQSSSITLSVALHYRSAECHYAECRGAMLWHLPLYKSKNRKNFYEYPPSKLI
jgi:hypothetical protein